MNFLLVIGPEETQAARELVAFAAEEANWYQPDLAQPPPGENPKHCLQLNDFRCVFSITKAPDGSLYRHLSVSVPTPDKFPSPEAFDLIAQLFGFPEMNCETHGQYGIHCNKDEGCIVAVYPFTLLN